MICDYCEVLWKVQNIITLSKTVLAADKIVREVIIRKKKVVNFHNFGPDPPLKVVKP